ncbi:MAG TPA: protein-export chaperone SecB [Gammaproteobacteria bacterium]|nr:protein-export chaperone SecB [Gammaproteobacteria bacterium]
MADEQQANFNLKKIYIKDASFESPMSPQSFLQQQTPEVDIQLDISHSQPDEAHYEVVLTITVTAKSEENTVFLCEVQQAGLFQIAGVPEQEMPMVLEIACPNILLPYVRQTIDDLVGKGGFPQMLIHPVNFEGLFQQKALASQKPEGAVN